MKTTYFVFRSTAATLLLAILPLLSFANPFPPDDLGAGAGIIIGTTALCSGTSATYTASVSGGSWSSSNETVAAINDVGVVTGITGGTAVISYSITNTHGTAVTTTTVTVNNLPVAGPINGVSFVCSGSSATLSNATSGGSWTSGNTARATIDNTGLVAGVSTGTAVISYTVTNECGSASVTRSIAVNPVPGTIGGASGVCVNAVTTLTNSVAGGVWSVSNPDVASVDGTGKVTGVSAGTVVISYTACSAVKTKIMTVNPLPSVPEISAGTGNVCTGATLALSESTTGGSYQWSSSSTAIATVNSSSGLVTGIAGGVVTISYKYTLGCTDYAMTTVTVNAPTTAAISGTAIVCAGGSTTILTADPEEGTWSSSAPAKAAIDAATGVVTGVAAGTSQMTYTYTNNYGCTSKTFKIVTVNALPSIATPGGASAVCVGATAIVTGATAGAVWSSGNPAIATIAGSGVVTGIDAGIATISYSITAANGCTSFRTRNVTVNALPVVPEISSGTGNVCMGSTLALSESTTGGTAVWISGSPATATVNSGTGVVTGIAAGTVTISYKYTLGCINYAMTTVTVNGPTAATISGTAVVCAGGNTTLSGDPEGGVWSSGTPAKATINASSGMVTAVAAGTSQMTYTYTNSNGCVSKTYKTVTVNALPAIAALAGASSVCFGATATVTATTTGGAWSSSNPAIANISSTGIVNGISAGTAVISYSVTGTNGCNDSRTRTITVNALPAVPEISSGTGKVCIGSTLALSESTTAGTHVWSSNATTIATVNSGTGVVTGIATGNAVISYKYTLGCTNYATAIITVNPAMSMTVTGTSAVCGGGNTIALTGTPVGGSWSSSAPAIATVDASAGVVTGIGSGAVSITYTSGTGCYKTKAITVNAQPIAIAGPDSLCAGVTATYTNAVTAGSLSWAASNTAVATVGSASGTVSAVSAGTTILTYTLTGGCTITKTIKVNALPSPINGPLTVCQGSAITLTSDGTTGTWSSSATGIATVGSNTGIVSAIAMGSASIIYTAASTGCSRDALVMVNPQPAAISGLTTLCSGTTATLNCTTGGASWSSTAPSVASVTTGGLVSALSTGTAVISYTFGTGCTRTTTVSVINSLPPFTGSPATCVGFTTVLGNEVTGGTWSTGNSAVATVTSTGLVSGLSAGTANITYSISAGCSVVTPVTIYSAAPAITGVTAVCVNGVTSLGNLVAGGAWSSSNPALATVGATGVVTGIAAGVSTISYSLGGGCYRTVNVTVKPLPGAISGNTGVCIGGTSVVTNGTGVSWASSDPSVATIGILSGVITGVSAGTAMITFNATNGCIATRMVTVDAAPPVAAITGPSGVLIGHTITLSNATPGGIWSSNDSPRASVDAGGVVTGISAPAAIISYTITNGACSVSATKLITVTTHKPASPGIAQGAEVLAVRVYPNPTSGVFTIESPVAGGFAVYTLEGREVMTANVAAGANTISLPKGLATGAYMCRFSGADGSNTVVRLVYE